MILLFGCDATLSPFRGRLVVGKNAYVIFVADAPDGSGELFGLPADGGAPLQVTYSRAHESRPALSPDGGMVAFLRTRGPADSAAPQLWVLNLLTGADRELPLGKELGAPERFGWSEDGRMLYVEAGKTLVALPAPPAPPAPRVVAAGERPRADSSFQVWLGEPRFARAEPCANGVDLCLAGAGGVVTPLAQGVAAAIRWGADSVAYFVGGEIEVRPLGPGRARRLRWSPSPAHPREATYFPGTP